MRMLAILDPSSTPPGGWRFPGEGGKWINSGTYQSLFREVNRRKRDDGVEPIGAAEFEDCICRSLPPNANTCDFPAVNPHDYADLHELIALNAQDPPKHVWAHSFWNTLHRHRLIGGDQDTIWLRAYTQLIPCKITCQAHFQQIQSGHPARFESEDHWREWTWMAHELVNCRLGKPGISLEEFGNLYPK